MGNVWRESYEGWRFIRHRKSLFLSVIQLSFAGVFILVISELATPIVTQLLKLSPNTMAFVFAPAGIGLVLGSVVMPRVTQRLGKSRAILIGCITLMVVTLLLPLLTLLARVLQPHSWNTNPLLFVVIALLMFTAGIALDMVNIPALTSMQEQSPEWIKGRVLALQLTLYNAFSIPIILFLGAFSDLFGIDRVLYLMSACELAFGLWGVYYERKHLPDLSPEPRGETQDKDEEQRLDSIAP
jgi:MFS family permease